MKNIGSVCSGSLKAEDLIPCFISELKSQKPLKREHRKLIREIESDLQRVTEQDWDVETLSEYVDELSEALNEYAPAYFYFGAHPGDGADFGYWLPDSFQQEFDGLQVNDLSEVPKSYRGEVLEINDHGNMTLFVASRGRLTEVWAIV